MHLVIDAMTQRSLKASEVCRFMEDCLDLIGMTRIDGPVVSQLGERIDGIVLLAESHISVHVVEQSVMVDIFSCKDFDPRVAARFTLDRLGLEAACWTVHRMLPGMTQLPDLTPEPLELRGERCLAVSVAELLSR